MIKLKECGIRKALEVIGATEVKITKGFHYQSGFFMWGEQLYYCSTADDRWPQLEATFCPDYKEGELPVMYRKALDRNDLSGKGGPNQWDFLQILHGYGYKLTKHPKEKERY